MLPSIAIIDTGVADWVEAEIRREYGFDEHEGPSDHATKMADALQKWSGGHRLWSIRAYYPGARDEEGFALARERFKGAFDDFLTKSPGAPNVIVMAQSTMGPDDEMYGLIRDLIGRGCVFVNAAAALRPSQQPWGMDGIAFTTDDAYPGVYPEVITVANAETRWRLQEDSAFGWPVDLAAPGTNIRLRGHNGRKSLSTGTSVSSMYVGAAVARLVRVYGKPESETDVRLLYERLRNRARYLAPNGTPILWRQPWVPFWRKGRDLDSLPRLIDK